MLKADRFTQILRTQKIKRNENSARLLFFLRLEKECIFYYFSNFYKHIMYMYVLKKKKFSSTKQQPQQKKKNHANYINIHFYPTAILIFIYARHIRIHPPPIHRTAFIPLYVRKKKLHSFKRIQICTTTRHEQIFSGEV